MIARQRGTILGDGQTTKDLNLLQDCYARILGRVGASFVVTSDLKLVMVPRLGYGIIFGVGIWPLWMFFQFYLVLLA
jgi:hypothetical protein